jgi:hypothetical protein
MRYYCHPILLIFLVFVVIGILSFGAPMAEAAEFTVLTLKLPAIETNPVPGTEVEVPVTVVDGYTNADLVDGIVITIEYDSSVVAPKSDGIVVHADTFGITSWPEPQTGHPNPNQLMIEMHNPMPGMFPALSEPSGGFPADLLTIKFVVQSFHGGDSTDLLFVDDTYFAKRNFDKLLLDGNTVNGSIYLKPTGSTKISLSLPEVAVYPPVIGDTVVIPLNVVGGYKNADLVDVVELRIEYDSSVVKVVSPTTDVVVNYTTFGITFGKWLTFPAVITNPENPTLPNAHQLKIVIQNQSTANPALSEPTGGFPATLLTIKFTVQSDNPSLCTRCLFIDDFRSYFSKRDLTKLPVDLTGDPHGDICLPVELSALGAIWNPNGTKIFWEASSQHGNLGWNIYRSETKDGKFVKVNGELIKGAGTTSNSIKYSFIDKDAEKGKIYYYYLEDISFNGEKHRTNIIKSIPVNKVTSWGDIKRSALR